MKRPPHIPVLRVPCDARRARAAENSRVPALRHALLSLSRGCASRRPSGAPGRDLLSRVLSDTCRSALARDRIYRQPQCLAIPALAGMTKVSGAERPGWPPPGAPVSRRERGGSVRRMAAHGWAPFLRQDRDVLSEKPGGLARTRSTGMCGGSRKDFRTPGQFDSEWPPAAGFYRPRCKYGRSTTFQIRGCRPSLDIGLPGLFQYFPRQAKKIHSAPQGRAPCFRGTRKNERAPHGRVTRFRPGRVQTLPGPQGHTLEWPLPGPKSRP